MRSTLTLILTILATFCQAECPIECYCDRQVTTCTGDKLLRDFPKFSQDLASRLELHEYTVSYLSREDFLQIISNLSELSFTRNSLESFHNQTFSLPNEPATPSTRQSENHFSSPRSSSQNLEKDALKLRILDLSQNKLVYFVGGGRLQRLKLLDLSSNELQQVFNLGAIERLESVNLRDNRISFLQPATFQGLKYLQYINLDTNSLSSVDPSTFSNLPALAHLIFSSNPVTNLVSGFLWNSRVQFVDVSHVGLTSIPSSLTKTVRDFRLANNNLTIIRQTDFESYPNVGLLVLDENAIETVEDDAFGRLDFLTRLWMNGNRLRHIPQNLPPFLQSLHLEGNLISNLTSTDFHNLHNLQELNLHGNRIPSLPPFIFSELSSLTSLDLRSNEIDVLYRHTFTNLSSLRTLDVSQNPIKVIVTGAFSNLVKLSLLHLSRLEFPIEFDPSSLMTPLQSLQILLLDDSPHFAQKLVHQNPVSLPQNLHELNLERCSLTDFNAVSTALAELNLRIIKLAGNPWDCRNLFGWSSSSLMRVVDGPECDQPPNLRGVLLSSLNFSSAVGLQTTAPEGLGEEEGNFEEENNLLDFTELTPDLGVSEEEVEKGDGESYGSSVPPTSTNDEDISGTGNLHTSAGPKPAGSLDKVTNASNTENTNSPENAPHALDANVNPVRSTSSSVVPGPRPGRLSPSPTSPTVHGESGPSTKNEATSLRVQHHPNPTPPSVAVEMSNGTVSKSQSVLGAAGRPTNGKASPTNRFDDSFRSEGTDTIIMPRIDSRPSNGPLPPTARNSDTGPAGLSDLDDAVPTRSYFDDFNSRGSGTNSISLGGGRGGESGGDKKLTISSSEEGAAAVRTASSSLDKTKTNDDNTIIDEGGRRRSASSSGGDTNDEEETAPKSIDGFPSDVDGLSEAASSSASKLPTAGRNRDGKPPPKAFHLRRESQPSPSAAQMESTSGAIIVKTVVISATVCLVSVLLLLSLSFAVYKVSQRRQSPTFICGAATRRKSEDEEDASSPTGASRYTATSYTRFGRKSDRSRSSCNQNLADFDSDSSDQVELRSGITNRLYFSAENEEIYHIT